MESGNETKVISIKDRATKASAPQEAQVSATPADYDFAAIMKRNSENGSRQNTERDKANKGVIRSYRLKH